MNVPRSNPTPHSNFDLEIAIAQWRHDLAAAGINRIKVIDELESHLRDAIVAASATGQSPANAFLIGVNQLGDAKNLCAEYRKANRHWLWFYRDNPLPLKIVAAVFILGGLNWLAQMISLMVPALNSNIPMGISLPAILMLLIVLKQTAVGVGLLKNRNRDRITAQLWAGLVWSSVLFGLLADRWRWITLARFDLADHSLFFGMNLPNWVSALYGLANLFILGWSFYYLNKRSTRLLFKSPATVAND